jgi:hypothetical protein
MTRFAATLGALALAGSLFADVLAGEFLKIVQTGRR